MFIQIEKTPDAATLRFLPGRAVLGTGRVDFADRGLAARSPLAARLFAIETIEAVGLGADFVAVTKAEDADWQLLKPAVLGVIMEHFLAGRPLFVDAPAVAHEPEDAEVVARIEALLDTRIRPALAHDGGDVVLRSYRGGSASLELQGAAGPVFAVEARIENTLRHHVPEVAEVHFVRGAAADEVDLDWENPEVVAVHALLEDEINPAIAAHGGHISLVDIKDHAVHIRLEGGCQGCGMADVTLKQGVEVAIMQAVPTITEVRDATDHAGGADPYYQSDKGGVSPF